MAELNLRRFTYRWARMPQLVSLDGLKVGHYTQPEATGAEQRAGARLKGEAEEHVEFTKIGIKINKWVT
jgi:hypothetical protein